MSSGTSIPLDKLVKTYIKIRDRRSEVKTEFDKEDSILVEQLDAVKGALLEHCKEHDVSSVKTSEGLFYRTVKQTYWTSDWDQMHKRLNQKNMKEFLESNPDLLPKGLNSNSTYTISVRRK
jgi:hypothetical protein